MQSLTALIFRGDLTFGVEFGNAIGFYSAVRAHPAQYGPKTVPYSAPYPAGISQPDELTVLDRFEVAAGSVQRSTTFRIDRPVALFDLVSRFVVTDRSGLRAARINGISIEHRCSNIYHQFPAQTATVPVGEGGYLQFTGDQSGMPDSGFEHVFYVRDESSSSLGNRWIVHHRVVATTAAQRFVLRGCNPRIEGPAPHWLNNLIPQLAHRKLFRIRERCYPNFPLMSVAENDMQPGQQVQLNTRVVCHE